MARAHEQGGRREEIKDAVWVFPNTAGYIDSNPPLKTSLFDDPEKLRQAWADTLTSLRAEAEEPAEERERVRIAAEELIATADAAVAEKFPQAIGDLTLRQQ